MSLPLFPSSRSRRSRRLPVLRPVLTIAAGLAAVMLGGETARAATYNWGGGTGNWSDGTQWTGGVAPPSTSIDTVLEFGNGSGSGTYTSTDDAAENTAAFTLNGMIFDGTGVPVIAGSAHSLTFVNNSSAASPFMSVNSTASNTIGGTFSNIAIGNGIVLNLNGSSTGQLSLGTVINGGGSILINPTGSAVFALTSPNTFTGGVTMSSGRLALTSSSTVTGGVVTAGSLGTGTFLWNGGYVRASGSTPPTGARTIANAITIGGNIGLGDNIAAANANNTLTLSGATTLSGTAQTYTFSVSASAATVTPVAFTGAIGDGGGANGILINAAGSTLGGTVQFGGTTANTYTGTTTVGSTATTISSTLLLSKTAGVTAVPGALTINNTGTVRLGASDQIADTSVVTMASSNAASYTPAFDLNGSSETVNSIVGATVGLITNGGTAASTLTLNNVASGVSLSTNTTYTGAIKDGTGTVALVKNGNDTLVLNGTSTTTSSTPTSNFSGGTTLNSGAIAIGSTAALGTGTITLNGGFFRGTGTFVGTLNNAVNIGGDVTLGANTPTTSVVTLAGPTTLVGTGVNRNLFIGGAFGATTATPVVFGGAIGDGGNANGVIVSLGTLPSAQSGTLVFNGNNTYTGTTAINSGTLFVNGNTTSAIGAVTVGLTTGTAIGTLGGTGTIGGATTVNAKGMLSVGTTTTPVSTLRFANSLTLGGVAAFDANGAGGVGNRGVTYDLVNVTAGALTYGGALTLNLGGTTTTAGTQYDLFDFTGAQSGTFTSISVTNAGGGSSFGGTFDYTSGILTLTAVPEPSTWVAALLTLGAFGLHYRRSRKMA